MLLSEVTTGLQDAEQGDLVKHGSTRPGNIIRLRSKWQVVQPTNLLHYRSMLWNISRNCFFLIQQKMGNENLFQPNMCAVKHRAVPNEEQLPCWLVIKLAEVMGSGCGFLRRRLCPSRRFLQLRLVSSNSTSR
jgi:hypothetical protein